MPGAQEEGVPEPSTESMEKFREREEGLRHDLNHVVESILKGPERQSRSEQDGEGHGAFFAIPLKELLNLKAS